MTVAGEMLYGVWPHGARVTLAGLWCQLSAPFGCVVCGAVWVMLWCGLNLAIRCVGSGASSEELQCRSCLATASFSVVWGLLLEFDCLLFVLGLVALDRGYALRLAAISVRIWTLFGYHDVSCIQLLLVLSVSA